MDRELFALLVPFLGEVRRTSSTLARYLSYFAFWLTLLVLTNARSGYGFRHFGHSVSPKIFVRISTVPAKEFLLLRIEFRPNGLGVSKLWVSEL
jgi:hypothetical protein